MRKTEQRKIILRELKSRKSHPTVDELYPDLKKILPSLSLGSLYRNLEVLANEGLIAKIEGCGASKRFDACVKSHFHFQCLCCGGVSDYENEDIGNLRKFLKELLSQDASIRSFKIEFQGYCPNCEIRKKGKISDNKKHTYKEKL